MNEAIILAGGFGTRLKEHVPNIPKPMAPINGRPFLDILLSNLSSYGITKVILSVGYLADYIQDYFGNKKYNIDISYNIESSPLGTGGAIFSCLHQCKNDHVFVLNGDTFINVNFSSLEKFWNKYKSPIIVTRKAASNSRYGLIKVDKNIIKEFNSSAHSHQKCLINAGLYVLPRNLVLPFSKKKPFSFESEYLPSAINLTKFISYEIDSYFIDIGIPEDYQKAQTELESNLND
tara:strand:+ start:211 stop:912 length:702 start_codon:yes stop_codon:yes gene_type:complete